MSGSVLWPVQQALYALLAGDGTLGGLVNGIYDQVPENTALPYITLDAPQSRHIGMVARVISELTVPVSIWSKAAGKKEALEITQRLHELLHEQPLTLANGHQLLAMRVDEIELRQGRDDDGMTQAVMRLQIMVEHG